MQLTKSIKDSQALSKTIDNLKTSLTEYRKTSDEQLASRDKLIRDQGITISAYQKQDTLNWFELGGVGIGGFGLGFVAGHFIK